MVTERRGVSNSIVNSRHPVILPVLQVRDTQRGAAHLGACSIRVSSQKRGNAVEAPNHLTAWDGRVL